MDQVNFGGGAKKATVTSMKNESSLRRLPGIRSERIARHGAADAHVMEFVGLRAQARFDVAQLSRKVSCANTITFSCLCRLERSTLGQ